MESRTFHVWRAGLSGSLVGGVLGAPISWVVQQQCTYWLIKHAQHTQHYLMLHLVTIGCLLIALGCGVLSYIDWRRVRHASVESPDDGRCRFLAVLGMCSSGLFSLVIIATGLAAFFFNAIWE